MRAPPGHLPSLPAWTELDPGFALRLPDTHARLRDGGLVVHPAVAQIVVHGSRGINGGCRPDSDIDLSLVVAPRPMAREALATLLAQVIGTTLGAWRGHVDLDLVAVFDVRGCGLGCFDVVAWGADEVCPSAAAGSSFRDGFPDDADRLGRRVPDDLAGRVEPGAFCRWPCCPPRCRSACSRRSE